MNAVTSQHRRTLRARLLRTLVLFGVMYVVAAYVLIPLAWQQYARRHPTFDQDPRITEAGDGHPGDPLNVAIIGEQEDLIALMRDAGWQEAAALGLWSDMKIAGDTVLDRPDERAPISRLYLFGRVEDLAFEKAVGNSPRRRHHVRFWKTTGHGAGGLPAWLGSATFDRGVGLSHTTGQITHHIDSDVDRERDELMSALAKTGRLLREYSVDGFHTVRAGRNGGGDPWRTDGRLRVGIINEANAED